MWRGERESIRTRWQVVLSSKANTNVEKFWVGVEVEEAEE
jgi:hypothetical protein